MNKRIRVFLNGEYIYTTTRCRTCKEAIQKAREQGTIRVASLPKDYTVTIKPEDRVTAKFSK